jgi:hypothetical protein
MDQKNTKPKKNAKANESNSRSIEVVQNDDAEVKKENTVAGDGTAAVAQKNVVVASDSPATASAVDSQVPRDEPVGEIEAVSISALHEVNNMNPNSWLSEVMANCPKPSLDLDAEDLADQFKLFRYKHEQKMKMAKVPTADKEQRAAAFKMDLPTDAKKILMNTDWTMS